MNKTAIVNAAQKYLAKGQIDKAIAEWEKLLEEGKDGNVHNTIGDLYLRKGDEEEAIKFFVKAAEIFKKDGFYPKAIALYKKILNIVPNDVECLIASAKLHAERGLLGNAVENYFKAAEIYHREGSTEKAIIAIEKVLQLSPSDINTRIKIAEMYLRFGSRARAAIEFVSIASYYTGKNEYEKAQEFYLRAMEVDPENVDIYIGMSSLAEKMNNTTQAFEYLEKALSQNPQNREVLLAYSNLAIRTNNMEEAKNSLLKIISLYPSDIQAKKILGNIYFREGMFEKAWEIFLSCVDEAINAENWSEALHILDKFAELYPVPVKEKKISIYRVQGDEEGLSNELRELAELHERNGSQKDALQCYKQILDIHLGDVEISKKIREIELALGLASPEVKSPLEEKLSVEEEPKDLSEEFVTKKTEADFYAQQGLIDEAVKIYEELISTFPDNEEIKNKLESLKPSITRTEHEVIVEKGVQEVSRVSPGVEDELKVLFEKFNHPMDRETYHLAITELHKILEGLSPADAIYLEVKYGLAEAYFKGKDYKKAYEIYSEICSQDPAFKDASQKVETLKSMLKKSEESQKRKRDRVSYI
jgi:tetratricopeptide (TPR) repeat protein